MAILKLSNKVVAEFPNQLQERDGAHTGNSHDIDFPNVKNIPFDIKVRSIFLAYLLFASCKPQSPDMHGNV